MKIGLDTNILVYLMGGNEEIARLVAKAREKKDILFVSVITIAELYKYSYRQKLSPVDKREWFVLLSDIEKGLRVVDLTSAIARRAASLSHGSSLHLSDALILAALIDEGCDEFYTTDSDFRVYRGKSPKIHMMSLKREKSR